MPKAARIGSRPVADSLHLNGKLAAALMAKAPELFAGVPGIEKIDVLTEKLP